MTEENIKKYDNEFENWLEKNHFNFLEDSIHNIKSITSPLGLRLKKELLAHIQEFVSQVYKEIQSDDYLRRSHESFPLEMSFEQFVELSKKESLLTSFDFHTKDNQAKLIEINTNASGYLMSCALAEFFGQDISQAQDHLLASFQSAFPKSIDLTIVDENIKDQKMFIEFLMYQKFLQSEGYSVDFVDTLKIKSLGTKLRNVYNRSTDFYFEDQKYFLEKYLSNKVTISPHPVSYHLWAEKNQLSYLQEKISSDLFLKSGSILNLDFEELVKSRKSYFFKPRNSFGSKGVYSGKSISKKKLEEIYNANYLYQELATPDAIDYDSVKWKYDVRVYVRAGEVIWAAPRFFKGQVTGGGGLYSGYGHLIWD